MFCKKLCWKAQKENKLFQLSPTNEGLFLRQAGRGLCAHTQEKWSTLLPSGKARIAQPCYLLHLSMVIIPVSPLFPETAESRSWDNFSDRIILILVSIEVCKDLSFFSQGLCNVNLAAYSFIVLGFKYSSVWFLYRGGQELDLLLSGLLLSAISF